MKISRFLRHALLFAVLGALPISTFAQISIGISITTAPPVLPIYVQPPCPAPNYIWTPGYWAWGPYGYYWVPGTWVLAPAPGLLWTPGYWGWSSGIYAWNPGYWGPVVGFYGGVNYGFGYGGTGFYGGRWIGGAFSYNTAVVNVNTTIIRNTYIDRTVIVNNNVSRVSFNGGQGGIQARPSPAQLQAANQRRFGPVAAQTRQDSLARDNRENYAAVNKGLPPHAALQRPATSAADFNKAAPARGARPASELRTAAAKLQPVSPAARPGNTARPATPSRPATAPARPETRPATPAERPATRPAQPAARPTQPTPAPRPETRPAPAARPETRPAPAARPAPAPRTESRPAPQAKPAPKPQERPAEKPREERPQGI